MIEWIFNKLEDFYWLLVGVKMELQFIMLDKDNKEKIRKELSEIDKMF